MSKSLKKFSVFISSFFIFLIHLPFVFAKTIPHKQVTSSISISTSKAANSTHDGEVPNSKVNVYDSLQLNTLGLSKQAFDYAVRGFKSLLSMGKLTNDSIISIVDFSLSSAKKRLFVIDLKNYKVLYNTYVAHGRNSGAEFAERFSNNPRSNKSSLGFYVTGNTYDGEHGYSLHLEGEEKGINDNAYKRAIVMHCADYVNEKFIESKGYIGRSLGCPAIPKQVYKPIINEIKDGSCLFLYSPNQYYISHSIFLKNAS
ncbi:MAG TPA: murein L,D-transpeptidase catalytic domain family protein [Ginsengibacter sp.]|nr:murein L,D-transpeptidase catalytic domain family protein [Ginsengibacter sp.]